MRNKLLTLKKWVTIPEAARYLTSIFNENVEEADVLRFGLDGHLTLSVNFINKASVRKGGCFVDYEEWKKDVENIISWENSRMLYHKEGYVTVSFKNSDYVFPLEYENNNSYNLNNFFWDDNLKEEVLNQLKEQERNNLIKNIQGLVTDSMKEVAQKFNNRVPPSMDSFSGKGITLISDVWDLPLLGAERLDIEHKCQTLTNGPDVTLIMLDGAFVMDENGRVYQIQDRFDEKYIEYTYSEKYKKEKLDFLARSLRTKINNNEITEKDARELYKLREKNINQSRDEINEYYPAGELPEDSVVVIRTSKLREFEKKILSGEDEDDVSENMNMCDINNAFYAKELAIAVQAWIELYDKNPPKKPPVGGHKKYIKDWLKKNFPDLGTNAQGRISTVINPNHKGGPSPS